MFSGGYPDIVHIVVVPDDRLAEQKSYGKIVEIVRCRHHHRMVDAIDIDGYRHLFHQMIQRGQGMVDGRLNHGVGCRHERLA